MTLADGSSGRVDIPHQHDQRISAGVDRGLAAFIQLLADRNVIELGAANHFLGNFFWRFASEGGLDACMVRT